MNKDGYADLAVGEPAYDDWYNGKVFVYAGSAQGITSTTAAWSFEGLNEEDWLGWSIAGAGDVNKDGFDDLALGAPGDGGLLGTVYVFYGSASGFAAVPSWTHSGEAAYDNFGWSVAMAGDVNKDGYDDLLVGAPYATSTLNGKVYAFSGSSLGLGNSASWSMTGAMARDYAGMALSLVRDANGDGYSDVLIGSPGSHKMQGLAALYSGTSPSQIQVASVGPNKVSAFPSPAKDRICFSYNSAASGAVKILVFNTAFRLVAKIEDSSPGGLYSTCADVSGLANGAYIFQLQVNGSTLATSKFKVQR
jgi:hypothetical protein